jgi:hypothetical protein
MNKNFPKFIGLFFLYINLIKSFGISLACIMGEEKKIGLLVVVIILCILCHSIFFFCLPFFKLGCLIADFIMIIDGGD